MCRLVLSITLTFSGISTNPFKILTESILLLPPGLHPYRSIRKIDAHIQIYYTVNANVCSESVV